MNEVNILEKEFKRIKNMGWVQGVDEGKGSVGLTLERLLGKEKDTLELPDYLGIELKTHKKYRQFYTTLFNATPDVKDIFETKRIQDKYGYPDKILRNCKVFHGSINAIEKTRIGLWYEFQLEVNYAEKKVYLCIYFNNKLIDKETFWTFDLLREKLERKLSILAFIEAEEKIIEGKTYFRYRTLQIYHLRSFLAFLKAMENGYIIVNFTIGVFRTGDRKGQIHDHGVAFRIQKRNLSKLFISHDFLSLGERTP